MIGWVMCIIYVGELGWEFYVFVEFVVGVYEDLMFVGVDFGVFVGGYYMIELMWLEKGYCVFGWEFIFDYGLFEVGLMFICKFRIEILFFGCEVVECVRVEGLCW